MDEVEYMLESIIQLLRDKSEFAKECIFRYCVWLGHNEIVSVGEAVKSIFQEVFAATVEGGFHTEESNCKGILRRFRRIRDCL